MDPYAIPSPQLSATLNALRFLGSCRKSPAGRLSYGTLPDAKEHAQGAISRLKEHTSNHQAGRASGRPTNAMSALGQKRTCAAHKLMSALPPKATSNAT